MNLALCAHTGTYTRGFSSIGFKNGTNFRIITNLRKTGTRGHARDAPRAQEMAAGQATEAPNKGAEANAREPGAEAPGCRECARAPAKVFTCCGVKTCAACFDERARAHPCSRWAFACSGCRMPLEVPGKYNWAICCKKQLCDACCILWYDRNAGLARTLCCNAVMERMKKIFTLTCCVRDVASDAAAVVKTALKSSRHISRDMCRELARAYLTAEDIQDALLENVGEDIFSPEHFPVTSAVLLAPKIFSLNNCHGACLSVVCHGRALGPLPLERDAREPHAAGAHPGEVRVQALAGLDKCAACVVHAQHILIQEMMIHERPWCAPPTPQAPFVFSVVVLELEERCRVDIPAQLSVEFQGKIGGHFPRQFYAANVFKEHFGLRRDGTIGPR